MLKSFDVFNGLLVSLSSKKMLISTINAHSYNVSKKDDVFRQALQKSQVLIPDGVSVVWAFKWLKGQKLTKIAGADLFYYEMKRLQEKGGKCFFLGSTVETLDKIKKRASIEFPNISIETYSPPYKPEFTKEDNGVMVEKINSFQPDVLFIGLTAPKQEKWAYKHYDDLDVGHIGCIGAVFDFYAGTIKRAPNWMINLGLEWFYRLIKEPKRMWKRYIIGNMIFIFTIIIEKYFRTLE
ncbi:WecB/TagA/CpsF family glycosyltransferase [Carboxylicivirga linearis]|nr:WecB/TagA/CpsF family glycosyltransferase [Carboxylicivirga linearis]